MHSPLALTFTVAFVTLSLFQSAWGDAVPIAPESALARDHLHVSRSGSSRNPNLEHPQAESCASAEKHRLLTAQVTCPQPTCQCPAGGCSNHCC
jgi:hypothetical protein